MRNMSDAELQQLASQMDGNAPYRYITAFFGLLLVGKALPDGVIMLIKHLAKFRGSETLDYSMLGADAALVFAGVLMLYAAFKYLGPPDLAAELEDLEDEDQVEVEPPLFYKSGDVANTDQNDNASLGRGNESNVSTSTSISYSKVGQKA